MKYEAVFGDQGLFFDAQKDCEMVGNGHHKVENGKLMVWNFTEKRWCNSHTNTITISAMRRIIAEPKRWTVTDKKAGKLPDVGCKVFDVMNENEVIVKAINTRQVCLESPDGFIYLLPPDDIKPIESQEEKAARLREEDEFVMSLMHTPVHSGTSDEYFMQGARAAYRKMKGGE